MQTRLVRLTIATASVAVLVAATGLSASNHREAPITALDHKADITDLYAFVSYDETTVAGDPPEKVTIILSVDPLLEPANGPTLFPFDPAIRYEIHVDNDQDAEPDVTFRFEFSTEYQLPGVYTAAAGIGADGAFDPDTGELVVPPKITGFSSLGLNQRQSYEAFMVTGGRQIPLDRIGGGPMYAVPGNSGKRTMDYEALFQEAIYDTSEGVKLFAGTTDDAFWIDLGAAFDTASFRTLGSGTPGVLTAEEDAAAQNFASDMVSGYAVNSIAVEVPVEVLTSTGKIEDPTSAAATIGIWGATMRRQTTVRRPPGQPPMHSGPWTQVQRIGHPLINELVIGIASKDNYSMSRPRNDFRFEDFFLDPPLVGIVEALYGGALAVPEPPRFDLLPLVTYAEPIAAAGTPPGPTADLLRLNTGVGPTPPVEASRLGLLAGDAAGYPNGRRVFDDVVDIVLRVAVGGVLDPTFPGYDPAVNGMLGDGVNVNDTAYRDRFPYLGSAPDGRDRRHVDPGEGTGGTPLPRVGRLVAHGPEGGPPGGGDGTPAETGRAGAGGGIAGDGQAPRERVK